MNAVMTASCIAKPVVSLPRARAGKASAARPAARGALKVRSELPKVAQAVRSAATSSAPLMGFVAAANAIAASPARAEGDALGAGLGVFSLVALPLAYFVYVQLDEKKKKEKLMDPSNIKMPEVPGEKKEE